MKHSRFCFSLVLAAAFYAQSIGQSIPGNASGSANAQSGFAAQAPSNYRLGPEDIVTITVLKHPEFSGDFLVPNSGLIEVPVVGEIDVNGMSLSALEITVSNKLKSRLRRPEVTVTLKEARLQRVYVVGAVRLGGAYGWRPNWTIAQALSASGGLQQEVQPADVTVSIDTPGQKTTTVSYNYALTHPEDPNLQLVPGSTVRFDVVGLVSVYVVGKVLRPGQYSVRSDSASILSAVAQAGGVTPDGSLNVRLVHRDGKAEEVDLVPYLVQGDVSKPLPSVSTGDLVVIPEVRSRYSVLGYVNRPGTFPIPSGHVLRLSDAIASTEGAVNVTQTASPHGRITKIGVVRIEGGQVIHHIYSLDLFLNKGRLDQNPIVQDGDLIYVPQSNSVDLGTILTSIAATTATYYNVRH